MLVVDFNDYFVMLSLNSSFSVAFSVAFGKRLLSAGRRFQAMGQYGQGELARVLCCTTILFHGFNLLRKKSEHETMRCFNETTTV